MDPLSQADDPDQEASPIGGASTLSPASLPSEAYEEEASEVAAVMSWEALPALCQASPLGGASTIPESPSDDGDALMEEAMEETMEEEAVDLGFPNEALEDRTLKPTSGSPPPMPIHQSVTVAETPEQPAAILLQASSLDGDDSDGSAQRYRNLRPTSGSPPPQPNQSSPHFLIEATQDQQPSRAHDRASYAEGLASKFRRLGKIPESPLGPPQKASGSASRGHPSPAIHKPSLLAQPAKRPRSLAAPSLLAQPAKPPRSLAAPSLRHPTSRPAAAASKQRTSRMRNFKLHLRFVNANKLIIMYMKADAPITLATAIARAIDIQDDASAIKSRFVVTVHGDPCSLTSLIQQSSNSEWFGLSDKTPFVDADPDNDLSCLEVDCFERTKPPPLPSPKRVSPGKHKQSMSAQQGNPQSTAQTIGLRPLTAAEQKRVDAALGAGPEEEVLADFESIPVTRYDMRTLCPGIWLNDEINNFYFKLQARKYPHIHFCQTNFYTKLTENGYCYKNVRRWTKKTNVFSKVTYNLCSDCARDCN